MFRSHSPVPRLLALAGAVFLAAACSPDGDQRFADDDAVSLRDHYGRGYNDAQRLIEDTIAMTIAQADSAGIDLGFTSLEDLNTPGDNSLINALDGDAVTAAEATEAASSGDCDYTWQSDVVITGQDGVRIRANLFHPVNSNPSVKFPGIVFPNSWSMGEHEYIVQAAKFAKKCYVVLSYSTRGFGLIPGVSKSDGQINVAGPKDMADLGKILDWMEAETDVDAANIGMAGISYGAGISLLGAATQGRVKTAVAMSGWTDLERALYGGESTRLVWGTLLIAIGYMTGTMDPEILERYADMLSYSNVEEVRAWAAERSPVSYIDAINTAQKPIYLANGFQDDLFQPNMILDFYERLEGPKKLDLSQGMHAVPEMPGLIGLDNLIWDNTHDWFDKYLKGEDTGIEDRPPVTMQKKIDGGRLSFSAWPAPNVADKRFELQPRTTLPWKAGALVADNGLKKDVKYYSGLDTFASTGIPILTAIFEGTLRVPTTLIGGVNDLSVSRINGNYYMETEPVAAAKTIAGTPRLKLRVTPSKSQAMFMAYLYDVNGDGKGNATLVTHGTRSLHAARAGSKTDVQIDLVSVAYELPAGHKLAVVLDTFDFMYAPPTLSLYNLSVAHSSSDNNELLVPFVQQ